MEKFKEFKGTKGEWYAVEYAGTYIIQDEGTYEGENILDEDVVGTSAAESNAKLIAAAPNLLQALQELYYLVSELPEEGSIIEALAKAKAAIEKAL